MYTADVKMHALYTAACVRHVMKPLRCNVMQNADDCTPMKALKPMSGPADGCKWDPSARN